MEELDKIFKDMDKDFDLYLKKNNKKNKSDEVIDDLNDIQRETANKTYIKFSDILDKAEYKAEKTIDKILLFVVENNKDVINLEIFKEIKSTHLELLKTLHYNLEISVKMYTQIAETLDEGNIKPALISSLSTIQKDITKISETISSFVFYCIQTYKMLYLEHKKQNLANSTDIKDDTMSTFKNTLHPDFKSTESTSKSEMKNTIFMGQKDLLKHLEEQELTDDENFDE